MEKISMFKCDDCGKVYEEDHKDCPECMGMYTELFISGTDIMEVPVRSSAQHYVDLIADNGYAILDKGTLVCRVLYKNERDKALKAFASNCYEVCDVVIDKMETIKKNLDEMLATVEENENE